MNPILTLSLAPLRLPVKMEEVSAAAPAAFRKSLRPVDACAMPLVVSGFSDWVMARGRGPPFVDRFRKAHPESDSLHPTQPGDRNRHEFQSRTTGYRPSFQRPTPGNGDQPARTRSY